MSHAFPYLDLSIDTAGYGSLDMPQRVIKQDLVIAHVNADRRQVREITIERRG